MTLHVNYNGILQAADKKILTVNNRSFLYGDGIFESIRVAGGKPLNLENHYSRLINGASTLKIEMPGNMKLSFFSEQIEILLQTNSHLPAARVRFTLFRDDGGLYQPLSNKGKFLIESLPLKQNHFVLNEKELAVDIFDRVKKLPSPLSSLKSCNALIYVMAKIFAAEKGLNDCYILNDRGNPVEATSSNLFIVKNNDIITPDLSEGCVNGTMRRLLLKIARKSGFPVIECAVKENMLKDADEIFLTNAIVGIKWVNKYKEKQLSYNVSKLLTKKLNEQFDLQIV